MVQSSGVFESYRSAIEAELRTCLERGALPVYDMQRYHMGWSDRSGNPTGKSSGKFLRSTLCLSSCRAVGGNPLAALPAGAAVELVHNFSLIHDDIEDRSEFRRHRPTVWKEWGVPQAVNAGDSMYSLAHLAALKLGGRVSADKVLRCTGILTETCRLLCEGQYLDISYEQKSDVTVDEYLNMASLKTGALMAASAQLGALLGASRDDTVEGLHRFGLELGLAYQIQDDSQGIWGRPEETGKSRYEDILQKKRTLPVLYAMAKAGHDGERLAQIYNGTSEVSSSEAEEAAAIMMRCGAKEYVRDAVEQLRSSCQRALQDSLDHSGRRELNEILASVLP